MLARDISKLHKSAKFVADVKSSRVLFDGIAEAVRGTSARCLVLTGAHGMFSSGYDIGDIPDDVFAEQADRFALEVLRPLTRGSAD